MKLIQNKEDSSIATNILVEAYNDAPNINWMFKQSHSNLEFFFYLLIDDSIKKRGAFLSSNKGGVLLFYNLNAKNYSLSSILRKAYLMIFMMGIQKSIQVFKLNKLKRKYRPKTGFYGMALAVKNDKHKWDTRLELKREFALKIKEINLPVYAETTNKRIYLLYEKLGFSVYDQMKHPYADLNIYFMKIDQP